MTIEEQIGQVLMVGFWGDSPSQEIIHLIQQYHIGNIILFSRNIRHVRQTLELTQCLQSYAREAGQPYPLLIATDQENGIVQRLGEAVTALPGNMALGAIGSEEVAYEVALAGGRELKALGINMNLAPVVDVNNNPANPVIGVRSFGEDPQLVARLGAAMVRGYREAGMLSCLKHFPGHGDTVVDSHLALPTLPHTLQRLQALELLPFQSGIAAGADSMMVAHLALPALTSQHNLPATLSSAILQGLLRQQLSFHGLILSDCLEMRAISGTFGTAQAAVLALQAGIDLLIVSHHYAQQQASIEAIKAAIPTGQLSPSMLQQAAERVLALKARVLSWNNLPTITTIGPTSVGAQFIAPSAPTSKHATSPNQEGAMNCAPTGVSFQGVEDANFEIIGCEAHLRLQRRAYELSTTLLRNKDSLIPLRLHVGEHIVILAPQRKGLTGVEDRYYADELLAEIIEQYHTPVSILPVALNAAESDWEQLLHSTSQSSIFIVATLNAHLDEQQAALVRYLIKSGRRVIGIALRNPYDLQAFPELHTCLVTYEYTRPALLAVVRVLFGESEAQGRLPVSIAGWDP